MAGPHFVERLAQRVRRSAPCTAGQEPVELEAPAGQPEAEIRVMSRVVATRRVSLYGRSAVALEVGPTKPPEGTTVQIDGATMFAVTPADTMDKSMPAAHLQAQRSAALLDRAIRAHGQRCHSASGNAASR